MAKPSVCPFFEGWIYLEKATFYNFLELGPYGTNTIF